MSETSPTATAETPSPTLGMTELPFQLGSISQAAAPDGGEAQWHRYVITQGPNVITGMRCGTREEVSVLLAGMVERLNERFGKQRAKVRR